MRHWFWLRILCVSTVSISVVVLKNIWLPELRLTWKNCSLWCVRRPIIMKNWSWIMHLPAVGRKHWWWLKRLSAKMFRGRLCFIIIKAGSWFNWTVKKRPWQLSVKLNSNCLIVVSRMYWRQFLLYSLLSGLQQKLRKPCIIWVICGTTSVSIRKQSPAGRLPCSRMIPSRPSCVTFPWLISISWIGRTRRLLYLKRLLRSIWRMPVSWWSSISCINVWIVRMKTVWLS